MVSSIRLTKRSLKCSPIEIEPHDIKTIIVYRPNLSVFSFSCRFTPVIPNITKEEGNFQIDIDIMMCLYLYTTC